MEKRLHQFDYNGRGQLLVDGAVWKDHALSLRQLHMLKRISERYGGMELVFTDNPIPDSIWSGARNLFFWPTSEELLKNVLYTHDWRGGCHSPDNVLKISKRYGTEMAYVTAWPKDLGPNSLVVWWKRVDAITVEVYLVFEHDLK